MTKKQLVAALQLLHFICEETKALSNYVNPLHNTPIIADKIKELGSDSSAINYWHQQAIKSNGDDDADLSKDTVDFFTQLFPKAVQKAIEVTKDILLSLECGPNLSLLVEQLLSTYEKNINCFLADPDHIAHNKCFVSSMLNEMLLQCACIDNEESMAWYMRARLNEYVAVTYQELQSLRKYNQQFSEYISFVQWCESFFVLFKERKIANILECHKQFLQHMQAIDDIIKPHITYFIDCQRVTNYLDLYYIFAQIILQKYPQYLNLGYCLEFAVIKRKNFLETLQNTLANPKQLWQLLIFVNTYYMRKQVTKLSGSQLQPMTLSEIVPLYDERTVQIEGDDGAVFSFLPNDWGQEGTAAVGDVHGHLHSLVKIIASALEKNPVTSFVFTGDLIDRGPHNFETCICIYLLLRAFPDRFAITLGNHDYVTYKCIQTLNPQLNYDVDELREFFDKKDLLKQMFYQEAPLVIDKHISTDITLSGQSCLFFGDNKIPLHNVTLDLPIATRIIFCRMTAIIFGFLPHAIAIGTKIFFVHGGIPLDQPSLIALMYTDPQNLLWSDTTQQRELDSTQGSRSTLWGPPSMINLAKLGITTVIRGHEPRNDIWTIPDHDTGNIIQVITVNSNTLVATEACYVSIDRCGMSHELVTVDSATRPLALANLKSYNMEEFSQLALAYGRKATGEMILHYVLDFLRTIPEFETDYAKKILRSTCSINYQPLPKEYISSIAMMLGIYLQQWKTQYNRHAAEEILTKILLSRSSVENEFTKVIATVLKIPHNWWQYKEYWERFKKNHVDTILQSLFPQLKRTPRGRDENTNPNVTHNPYVLFPEKKVTSHQQPYRQDRQALAPLLPFSPLYAI